MLENFGLERINAFSQLFVQRNEAEHIILIVSKVTDDFLCDRNEREIKIIKLSAKHTIGKIVIDEMFNFNGCEVSQDSDGNVGFTMQRYVYRIKAIDISRERKKQRDERSGRAKCMNIGVLLVP